MKRGKKYAESAKLVEKLKLYDTEEGLELCIKTAKAKFDETVEIHVRLGVDSPSRGSAGPAARLVLPNGTGKSVRVLAFCKGDNVQKAIDAGAEFAGSDEYVHKIQQEGWMDFDVVIATPDMMGMIGRLGKILGPRGLMPNPRPAPSPPISPRPSPRRRPVRSSTVWIRPISSIARSARLRSAPRSCRRTSMR